MPSLFSLAQHPALVEFQTHLADGEAVFAYLDDLYVVAAPERIRPLYDLLEEVLWRHARVQLNRGKTRIWNAAGEEPPHIAGLQHPVWVGAWTLPEEHHGMMVLGAPLVTEAYVHSSS